MSSLAIIIPVYNGANFIEDCINSCILQPEISEIIVVDDGSVDASRHIVQRLMKTDARISLYSHPDNQNKGRSASRNLGIKQTNAEWVAFCDADDFMLEGRFEAFGQLVDPEIDGFYEPVVSRFEDDKLVDRMNTITTVDNSKSIENLQDYLMRHREERISLIGIIIRRKLILDNGWFDEKLHIGEDTDFIWRIVGQGSWRMIPRAEPKVVRRVHRDNTYTDQKNTNEKYQFYTLWVDRIDRMTLSKEARKRITYSFRYYRYKRKSEQGNLLKKGWHYISYKLTGMIRK